MAEVIVALDVESGSEARRLVERIEDLRWVKIGPVLFGRGGPDLVKEFVDAGLHVFLDLKWHDIPTTVEGAVQAAEELGVSMATVHTLGGARMLQAATAAAGSLALVGVTVLTSHDSRDFGQLLGRPVSDVEDEVVRLATFAVEAGLAGVVASSHETARVRAQLGPDPMIVVPGIRQVGSDRDDQQRTATPREAVAAGATHLVVGRPITRAKDPGATFEELCRESVAGGV